MLGQIQDYEPVGSREFFGRMADPPFIPEDENLLADEDPKLEDIATSSYHPPRDPRLSRIEEASLEDSRIDVSSYVNQNSGLGGTSMLSCGTLPRAQTSLPREPSEERQPERSSTQRVSAVVQTQQQQLSDSDIDSGSQ